MSTGSTRQTSSTTETRSPLLPFFLAWMLSNGVGDVPNFGRTDHAFKAPTDALALVATTEAPSFTTPEHPQPLVHVGGVDVVERDRFWTGVHSNVSNRPNFHSSL